MHLTDCFRELIAYAVYFQKTAEKKQPTFDQVKADINRLFSKSEEKVKNTSLSSQDFDQARFAVCAWIDEVILNSAWQDKGKWQKEQLQRLFYQTADAGEEFFEKLNALGLHQREVREVYYLCLSLGFSGRYCQEGDQYLLDQLKTSNLKLLTGSSIGLPSLGKRELFPEAFSFESDDVSSKDKKFSFTPFTMLCLGSPVFLFFLLFIIYHFVLSGFAKNLLTLVP